MVTREATAQDWDQLLSFFTRVYRTNHPLQNRAFWEWQYGNPSYGRSFIFLMIVNIFLKPYLKKSFLSF